MKELLQELALFLGSACTDCRECPESLEFVDCGRRKLPRDEPYSCGGTFSAYSIPRECMIFFAKHCDEEEFVNAPWMIPEEE